ncbi:MaoC/PaaZ C-terminal domain-containing protein [Streptomyces sp. NPDC047000]|uniref:MaoC family dehydratase n=1 Tax=Streptomyces sp. NPDC047000 TaxID=3155474 RepID=UPI0033CEF7C5
MLRGALRSPFRRHPSPDAAHPAARLVLPGRRADLARLCAYERLCGFTAGEDAERDTLPLPYPHVLGFPLALRLMSGPGFPLPLLGLVHTSIGITRHAPLPADGTYELAVRIDGLRPHRRGTEAVVRTELRPAAGGGAVWESVSTYLARHRTESAPGGTTAKAPTAGTAGPLPPVAAWRLGDDIGRRYGAVSGDRNPIHLSPLTARLFGFPRAIAHGMWTLARCLAAHGVPPGGAVHVRAAFRAPVPLPGTVVYGADGGGRFDLRDATRERVHVSGELTRLTDRRRPDPSG